jgi:hypothetical protein
MWDASGWRTLITRAADMEVFNGLPGQLILPGTEGYFRANVGGVQQIWYRAPIALNQWRAYDPLAGAYLQPDDADRLGRLNPEGYVYARSSPEEMFDETGSKSNRTAKLPTIPDGFAVSFDSSCYVHPNIAAEWGRAVTEIAKCAKGRCGKAGGDKFLRQWMFAMQTGNIFCSNGQPNFAIDFNRNVRSFSDGSLNIGGGQSNGVTLFGRGMFIWERTTVIALKINEDTCLARVIAHEALHAVFPTLPIIDGLNRDAQAMLDAFQYFFPAYNPLAIDPNPVNGDNHDEIKYGNDPIEKCVSCPQ